MKYTNKFNIPQTFVNVLHRPTYSKGRANLSVTQLINSPKIVNLTLWRRAVSDETLRRVSALAASSIEQSRQPFERKTA